MCCIMSDVGGVAQKVTHLIIWGHIPNITQPLPFISPMIDIHLNSNIDLNYALAIIDSMETCS